MPDPVLVPPAIVKSIDDLKTLAVEIVAAHKAGENSGRLGLEHFKEAGDRLVKAKEQVEHGEFREWVATNTKLSPVTTARYMRISREWANVSRATHLSDALKMLVEEAEEPENAATAGSTTTTVTKPVLVINPEIKCRAHRSGQKPPNPKCPDCRQAQEADLVKRGGEAPKRTSRTRGGKGGSKGGAKAGATLFSLSTFKEYAGKMVASLDKLAHEAGLETQNKKGFAPSVVVTPEQQAIVDRIKAAVAQIGAATKALEKWQAELKKGSK